MSIMNSNFTRPVAGLVIAVGILFAPAGGAAFTLGEFTRSVSIRADRGPALREADSRTNAFGRAETMEREAREDDYISRSSSIDIDTEDFESVSLCLDDECEVTEEAGWDNTDWFYPYGDGSYLECMENNLDLGFDLSHAACHGEYNPIEDNATCRDVCEAHENNATICAAICSLGEIQEDLFASTKPPLAYDPNGSGETDVLDVQLVVLAVLGTLSDTFSESTLALLQGDVNTADVNNDGQIDVVDVVQTIQAALGLIDLYGFNGDEIAMAKASCAVQNMALRTDPGSYFATMPEFVPTETPEGNFFVQQPEPNSSLEPGPFTYTVADGATGDILCTRQGYVRIDMEDGPPVNINYHEAGIDGVAPVGNIPWIDVTDPNDELGLPLTFIVKVDGEEIDGTDLFGAYDKYLIPGTHTTEVCVYNLIGQSTCRWWSEFHQTVSEAVDQALKEAQHKKMLEQGFKTRIVDGDYDNGIGEGCYCRLEREMVGKGKSESESILTGRKMQIYLTTFANLSSFLTAANARYFTTDLPTDAKGNRTDKFTIVCYKLGSQTPVQDCKECCQNPVIHHTVRAEMDALEADAEDEEDRANIGVDLNGSGMGQYQIQNGIASGHTSWQYEKGIKLTGKGTMGQSVEKGKEMNAEVAIEMSITKTYGGATTGPNRVASMGPYNFTGWKTNVCEVDHTLSVNAVSNLHADGSAFVFWRGQASAKVLSDGASMEYTGEDFNCAGEIPTSGSSN